MKAFVQRAMRIPSWIRYVITFTLCGAIAYGWHRLVYVPLIVIEQQRLHARTDLFKRRDLFYALQRDVIGLRTQCDQLNKNIAKRTEGRQQLSANELIKMLIVDAEECGLCTAHCSPEKCEQKRWYKTEPVRFVSSGEYFDFVDILDKIKHYNCFSNVDEMNVEKDDDMLTLDCVVKTYRLE